MTIGVDMATAYREHRRVNTLGMKSATTKRYEAEGLIVVISDLSFAGTGIQITDRVIMTIEAETLESALAIANDALEATQSQTGRDNRKQNYIKIEQVD